MTRRLARMASLAALGVVSACAHEVAAPAPNPTVAALPRQSYATLAERALPSVILLVRREPSGVTHFGAGFLVEHGPAGSLHALTADHVVSGPGTLRALFYDRTRVSYTPMDGGLDRLLFENQAALRPLTVLEHDPVGDLALVAIDADPRVPPPSLPRLRLAEHPPRIGDEVLALGHPQETVWSFTRGVVSGLHRDMIQHDALSSGGSSGGPLVDLDGNVVGVNTAKIVTAVRGLGFARPIARARVLLVGNGAALDRSTPELAVRACWHAQEVGSPYLHECFDWQAAWRDVRRAIDRLGERLPEDAARVRADLEARGGYVGFLERNRGHFLEEYHQGAPVSPTGKVRLSGARAQLHDDAAHSVTAERARARRVSRERNGVRVDLENEAGMRDVLKKGFRLDEVRVVDGHAAWVRVGGRNPDGSPLGFSEYWVQADDGWRQRIAAEPADLARLPVGWPPPLSDDALQQYDLVEQLLERAEMLAGEHGNGSVGGPRVAPR